MKLGCLPQILSDTRDSLCEFLSGVLLVVFAAASEAPYLGAPFEIGFAGGSSAIWQVMFAIGVGLAFPYLMIAAIPQISKYVSSVKNVAKLLKFAAFVMLVAGAGRLIIIAAAQSSSVEFWHWLVYILSVFFVLAFNTPLYKTLFPSSFESLKLEKVIVPFSNSLTALSFSSVKYNFIYFPSISFIIGSNNTS